MKTTKTITCTVCPKGCEVTVVLDDKGKVVSVKGNSCSKGEKYAVHELVNPHRVLTSTVRMQDGKKPVVAVKTNKAIPLNKMMKCMEEVNSFRAKVPVRCGDVFIKDIGGTGADLVATGEAV